MKKKIIIIFILYIIISILVNIFYGFFYEDDIGNIIDKLNFRKKYNSRKIVTQTYDAKNDTNSMFSNNIVSISLSNLSYKKNEGKLKFNLIFSLKDKKTIEDLCFILKVHNNNNMFYNSIIGKKMYVDNTDYLLYNHNLYNKLSFKDFNIDNLNDKQFSIVNSNTKNEKNIEVCLNLKENYELSNNLYIEILGLIYKPKLENSYKLFDSIGELKYIVKF